MHIVVILELKVKIEASKPNQGSGGIWKTMYQISKEYVSDSSDEECEIQEDFQVPADYRQCKNLEKFNEPSKSDKRELWLMRIPGTLDISNLKSIPIDVSGEVSSEISCNSKKYTIREECSHEKQGNCDKKFSVLVPNGKDTLHAVSKLQVAKFFTISETVEIPAIQIDKIKVARSYEDDVEEPLLKKHKPKSRSKKKKDKKKEKA